MYVLINAVSQECPISALVPNCVVSSELLKEIHVWQRQGASFQDIIGRLRLRTVPVGYVSHTWHDGMPIIMIPKLSGIASTCVQERRRQRKIKCVLS